MIKAWNRSELCLRLRLRRQLGRPASLGFQCLTPRWELLLLSSDMPDESNLSFSVLCNSLVNWLHLSNVKPEWGLLFGSQPPSLSLSWCPSKCVAASYSPDTLVTSNQYFQESKTLSTGLRKTTQVRNASVPKNKSPTKAEKCLSSSQRFTLRLKRKVR